MRRFVGSPNDRNMMACHGLGPRLRIAQHGLAALLSISSPAIGATQDPVHYSVGALLIVQTALIAALVILSHRRRSARKAIRRFPDGLTLENQMTITGQITASIAHELAQPLSAILSNVETAELLLNRPERDRAALADILADIKRDNLRATEIAQRMRAMLHDQELRFALIDLNELISNTLALLRREAERRNIVIEAQLEHVPTTRVDSMHLQQVLINLLLNAMDATMHMSSQRRSIRVGTRTIDGQIEIKVADMGCGMSAAQLSHVFEPFFTTKQDGVGLGLSIARSIVQAHGGSISAHSMENKGTTFRITLPAREDERPETATCATSNQEAAPW